ncbi:MAG: T9SS type A sorting domain-containing protein, partial [Crocinitomicaceae bacterium]
IDNTSLALAYTTEFNEMWGSIGANPNFANSLFGPDKTDNTVHSFTIGGSSVESYFSPTDNTTAQIVDEINSADFTLDIAMFTFINNDLGDAVIAAKNRGVLVRCIIENTSYLGSEYNGLVSAGINVVSHQSLPYDFHHKYCIIDANTSSSNPTVITGSHNWTNSAEDEYDENTLIVHDLTIAQQYWEEFSQRWQEFGGSSIETIEGSNLSVFPNPSNGSITIQSPKENIEEIEVYNQAGKLISSIKENSCTITFNLPSGLYILQMKTDKSTYFQRVSVQ